MHTPRICTFLFACVSAFAAPGTLITQLPSGARPAAIEVSTQGDVYIAGSIWSSFPNAAITGSFAARYDPKADKLVYLHQFDAAISFTQNSLAVDANGAAYVAGDAPPSILPSVPIFGPNTATSFPWIAKLDPAGQIIYATVVPGVSSGHAAGIAVNAAGEVYVTGTATGITATPGAAVDRANSSFVIKLDATAANVLFTEHGVGGLAIALDAQENIYVAGTFFPSLANPFSLIDPSLPPATPHVFQHDFQIQQCGVSFAFTYPCGFQHVAKLDPTGNKLLYGLYLTGSLGAAPSSLVVDVQGDLFIAGVTPSSDYPITAGAVDAVYRAVPGGASPSAASPRLSFYDAPPAIGFVTELNPDASDLVFSTYLGGTPPPPPPAADPFNPVVTRDTATKIRLNNGRAYVTGIAQSTDFPGLSALSYRCLPTSYLLRLSADGRAIDRALSFPLIDAKHVAADAGPQALFSTIAFDPQGLIYQVGPSSIVYRADPSVPDVPGCIDDSATFQGTNTTAPGELLSVFGAWPVTSNTAANVTTGLLPTTLANVTVDFDGIPGRLLYASPDQINVMAPYEISGRASTTMNVRAQNGGLVRADSLAIVARRSSAFTRDLSPGGCQPSVVVDDLPLARNADGTLNDCTNPAHSGSVVTFYINGGGLPAGGGTSGDIAVKATPIGIPATVPGGLANGGLEVISFSLEPGSVSGVWRLDVKVPGPDHGIASLMLGIYVDGVLLQNRVLELTVGSLQ